MGIKPMAYIPCEEIQRGTRAREAGATMVWEFRSIDTDFVFMVGVESKYTAEDNVATTRTMSRKVFVATSWETVE